MLSVRKISSLYPTNYKHFMDYPSCESNLRRGYIEGVRYSWQYWNPEM